MKISEEDYEIAKRSIETLSFKTAEEFIYNLAKKREISFDQFRELNKIKRKSDV